MSRLSEHEADMSLAARFFDNERLDFQRYLADYLDITVPRFGLEACQKVAQEMVDTFFNVLDFEYKVLQGIDTEAPVE